MSNVMCMSSIVFVYTSSIVPVGCVLYMFSCYNKIIKKKNSVILLSICSRVIVLCLKFTPVL